MRLNLSETEIVSGQRGLEPGRFPVTLLAALAAILPCVVFAQTPDGSIVIPNDVQIHDLGWAQIRNVGEIGEFLLGALETFVFVAAIAFHPRARTLRDDARGWRVQSSMFFFGLIGMLIGFLVVHHGYLIGFVVFGLGGLFRFRMESSSLLDGALLILMTLIGLSVGLNLPVMALVATVAGWTTLWFVASKRTTTLELKFKDDEALRAALDPVRTTLGQKGFRIVSVRKTDFKPVVEMVLSHSNVKAANDIPAILEELSQAGHGAKDWYVV